MESFYFSPHLTGVSSALPAGNNLKQKRSNFINFLVTLLSIKSAHLVHRKYGAYSDSAQTKIN